MTDEEMAAIWVKETADSCRSSNMNAYEFAEQAFLDGLKAGKPKWHKVADSDLPKERVEVLDENSNKVKYVGYGKWQMYSEYYEKDVEVDEPIAWCEIPKFEED